MLGRTLSRGYRALRPLPSSSVYLRRSTLPTRAFSGTARACAEPVKPESHTGNKGYETVQPKATPKPPLSWYFSDFTTLDYAAFAGFFVMMGIIFYEAWPQSKRPEDFDGKEHLSKVYKPRSTSFITPDQPGKAHYDPPGYDIVNRTVPGQTARQQESQEDSEPESEPEPEADSKPEPTPEPEPVPPKPTVSEVTPIVNAAPVSQSTSSETTDILIADPQVSDEPVKEDSSAEVEGQKNSALEEKGESDSDPDTTVQPSDPENNATATESS